MKAFALSAAVALCVGLVHAGDMHIDFPLFLRAPIPATAASSTNLQAFAGALGGAVADPVTNTGDTTRPFTVDGETFTDFKTALIRSCNNQHNACAKVANSGSSSGGLTVGQCDTQQTSCLAQANSSNAASTTTTSAQPTLKSADAEFFYFCDP